MRKFDTIKAKEILAQSREMLDDWEKTIEAYETNDNYAEKIDELGMKFKEGRKLWLRVESVDEFSTGLLVYWMHGVIKDKTNIIPTPFGLKLEMIDWSLRMNKKDIEEFISRKLSEEEG